MKNLEYNVKIKVGCCGFPCAQDKYFKNFEVIEIQKTFYSLPSFVILAAVKVFRQKGRGR